MAIIDKTTINTIKRIRSNCIEDLLDMYTSKDLTKEKENLLTIYLNADIGYSYVKSFYELGYELQLNKIDVKCSESFIEYYFKTYDMQDFSKFFKNGSVSQNILKLSLYFPNVDLFKKAMEIDNLLDKNCLNDFFQAATKNLLLNNQNDLNNFIKIVDDIIDIIANNKHTDFNCIHFFKEETLYHLIDEKYSNISNLIEKNDVIRFNIEKWEKTMIKNFLENQLEKKNNRIDKKIKI